MYYDDDTIQYDNFWSNEENFYLIKLMIYQTNHEKNHLPIIGVINRESKLVKWVFKNTSVNYQLQSNKLHLQIAHGDNSRLAKVRYFIVKKVKLAFFFHFFECEESSIESKFYRSLQGS